MTTYFHSGPANMPKQLDVYHDWLAIQETNRPLNNYQLLRLKKFEDDPGKIREHYRKMNAHVRKFAGGEFAKESQDLLNELSRAMLCLTDAGRKGEYDATLGRAGRQDRKQHTFEELLLLQKVIEPEQLSKARNYAKAVGVEVRDALVQQKLAKAEVVVPAYAESIGLPFLDLSDIELDPALVAKVPVAMARQHSCVPIMIDDDKLLMASPNPLDPHVEEELRLRFGTPVRTVLCVPANISDALTKFYGKEAQATQAAAGVAVATSAGAPKQAKQDTRTPEEKKKRRIQMTFMAFNFTFMANYMFHQFFLEGMGFKGVMLGFVIAAMGAGACWIGMSQTGN
jgi:Type II secretion system (T2SS), protein E, N-terminal domain